MELHQAFLNAVTGVLTMLETEALCVLGGAVLIWACRTWHEARTW